MIEVDFSALVLFILVNLRAAFISASSAAVVGAVEEPAPQPAAEARTCDSDIGRDDDDLGAVAVSMAAAACITDLRWWWA